MYTVVLMAALSTTPSTQAWHRARGCNGCSCGGYASCYSGANGGGWGCYGCYGYGHPWSAASWTSGSYGNGVFGPGAYGHGVYGTHPAGYGCAGCHGAYSGGSCYGHPSQHAVTTPAPPSMPLAPEGRPETKPGKTYEEAPLPKPPIPKSGEQARVKVIIDLPADARLFVDGQPMKGTSSRRMFQTPELIPGQTYYYELRAEIERDGQIITANQRIILQPGRDVAASFADLGQRRDATARTAE